MGKENMEMTYKQAIEIIEKYEVFGCGYCHQGGKEIKEAFNMATQALQKLEQIENVFNKLKREGYPASRLEDIWQIVDPIENINNMRDATPEEQESIDRYIKSISKPTGVNIFDFYEDEEQEQIDFVQPKKKIPCTIKVQADGEHTACDTCIYKVNDNQTMANECYGCNENPYILIKSWGKKCANCKHHTDADEIHGYTPCGNCGIEQSNYEPKDKAQADGEYISKNGLRNAIGFLKKYNIQAHKTTMDAVLVDDVIEYINGAITYTIPPEHDGCKDCKYETYPEYYYPCCDCKQNYVDKWERAKHWIHRNDDYNDWLECPSCGYGSEGEVKYGEGTPYCPYCGERLEEK